MESIVQHVPTEIVREILKYLTSPMFVHADGCTKEFPWYLGHVCSSWRAIFLSMNQEFWRKFSLSVPSKSGKPLEQRRNECVAIAETFLEHNRGIPFTFAIRDRYRWHLSLLDVFMRESTLWKDAEFSIFHENEIMKLLPIKHRLPLLESLTVMVQQEDNRPVHRKTSEIFKDAPLLTHVHVADLTTFHFNWSSLTTFEFTRRLPDESLLSVLPLMESLECLFVNHSGQYATCYHLDQPITLPHLRILSTSGFDLLSTLTTPLLKKLYIEGSYTSLPDVRLSVCEDFFQRSSCRLERLGIRTALEIVAGVLRLAPETQVLSVDLGYYPAHPQFYNLLTASATHPALAPAVRSLRIVFPRLMEDFQSLTTMIASRTTDHVDHRLEELTFVVRQSHLVKLGAQLEGIKAQCMSRNVQLRIVEPDQDIGDFRKKLDVFMGRERSVEPLNRPTDVLSAPVNTRAGHCCPVVWECSEKDI